jgi:hypothetical protein
VPRSSSAIARPTSGQGGAPNQRAVGDRAPQRRRLRFRAAVIATLLIGGCTALFAAWLLHNESVTESENAQPSSVPEAAGSSPTSPLPAGGCVSRPSSCGYPDASNTGVPSTALKNVPGDVTQGSGWYYDSRGWVQIDGAGAVFSGYRVSAGLNITADNVTVKNTVIEMPGNDWGIALRHADGVTIDHNTIRGQSVDNICDNGIRDIYGDSNNVKITANNIYHCASGINHFNAGGLIKGNFIHDLGHACSSGDSDCGHFNGIQLGAGTGPLMTIDNNTIFNPSPVTDCIMLANDDGPQTNRTITNNLLAGGGYSFYGSGWDGAAATNIVFTGNKFSTLYFPNSGSYGPVAHWQRAVGNVWSNNTWIDGPRAGRPVS